MIVQLIANGIINGFFYALVALGFSLIYSSTKIFHFAHGAVYTLSAYTTYLFLHLIGVNYIVSVLSVLLISIVLGFILESFIYYPLYKKGASKGVFFISSLGAYILLVNLITLLFGNEPKILRPGVETTYQFGPVILSKIQIIGVTITIFVLISTFVFLKKHKYGRAIRALCDNPTLVSILGINVRKIRLLVFGIGSFLAALAAIFPALDVGIEPHIGLPALLTGVVAVIIGGVGIFEGAIIGAFLLGLLQNLLIWKFSTRWEEAITLLILIIFLLYRPQGILGKRGRLEEV
jgi:branched-chain amino acid transport system permease protein